MSYNSDIPSYGELMDRKEFLESVACYAYVDYDGYGYPVKDGKMDETIRIFPSQISLLPDDCTHIIWFNK